MIVILLLLVTSSFEALDAADLYDFGILNGDNAWGNVRNHEDQVVRLNNNDNVGFKFYNEMFDQVFYIYIFICFYMQLFPVITFIFFEFCMTFSQNVF